MLVIRLLRIGRKHQPSYKIVVTDSRRAPKGGRFAAEVGSWNPLTKQLALKKEEIKSWLSKGAKPSDTVYNILVKESVIEGKKVDVHKKSKKPAEAPKEEAKPTAEAKPAEEAPKEEPKTEEKPTEEVKTEEKPAEPKPVEEEKKEEEKPAEEKPEEKVDKSA